MFSDSRGYVYETARVGGRVVRNYIGRGELAGLLLGAQEFDRRRETRERAHKKEQEQREREAWLALKEPLDAYCNSVEALARGALQSAGYHRHKRGEWRKRRQNEAPEGKTPMPTEAIDHTLASKAALTDGTLSDSELSEVIGKARKGDLEAARRAWEEFDRNPKGRAKMIDMMGNAAMQVQYDLVRKIDGENALAELGTWRHLDDMQQALKGPNPSGLETMLAERITLCWLHLHYQELLFVQNGATLSIKQGEHHLKRLDSAQARYLAAIKTLATVRKLALPNIQINVADKQVNVGQVNGADSHGVNALAQVNGHGAVR